MTIFRSEETLVGIMGIGVFAWTIWTVQRGMKLGRLPVGRAYVRRDERRGAFQATLVLYLLAALMMIFISADLLFGFDFRNWL
ncbi:MAG: hypothetical protein H0W74_10010 [Sphingosinicella sp.]|nr:hypothetical protein [Sphingosinicella sp.]